LAKQKRPRPGLQGERAGQDLDQLDVVLLVLEAACVAEHQGTLGEAERGSELDAVSGRREWLQVNPATEHARRRIVLPALTKEVRGGRLGDPDPQGGVAPDPMPHQTLVGLPGARGLGPGEPVEVRMRDPHGHPRQRRDPDDPSVRQMQMAVHHVVGAMSAKGRPEAERRAAARGELQGRDHPATEGFQRRVMITRRRAFVHDEVHLKASLVEPANEMKQPGLNPALPHPADDLQDALHATGRWPAAGSRR
jgi:hypothetical protein